VDAGPAESGGGQTETIPTAWDDDFSSNSLAKYEIIPTHTQGGSGQVLYDDIGQRLHFSTGADVGIMLNLTIAGQSNGVVNTEFLPSTSYSPDGTFSLRLKQDAENYYEIINTSSGSIGAIDKVVDGEVVESLSINNEFITDKNYHITLNYSPQYTKILAFGDMYTLDINNADISVSHIEIELNGQDGYIDNLRFAEMPSDQYVAMGDSITKASFHDDIDADGTGYEPILSDLLTQAKEYPNVVVNKGVSGDASADGLSLLPSLLNQYPQSRFFLIQYGTNDAWAPVPSGLGLEPGDANYPGTFKDNMQQIIDMIKANGKIPYLAKVPKAFDARSFLNDTLQTYNMVIDELVAENNIGLVPPDFYCHFENHPEEMDDTLHPNGLGYISMANIWFEALMDQYGGCTP
jgi:lysophospholipase L1-like esterase